MTKNQRPTSNNLYWVYLIGFFLILALPLLNLPPWFSPPDWGKTIVFRIILSILIFIFLWQILSNGERFSVKFSQGTKIVLSLLLALFLVYLLATIFSLDRNFSLWGNPYRSGGFVNFAFYIIFAVLAFLILRDKDWQKIWDFALIIGILVSIIAIFQQFGLISKVFIPFETRPPSTLGGPIFLAIYLSLLSFLAFSFGLKEENLKKKLFYFFVLTLFLFTIIFITLTRAAFVGLVAGFLWFLFFYPVPEQVRYGASPKRLVWLKISAFILLFLGIYGIYYINTQPELPKFIQENKILLGAAQRLSIKAVLQEARISGWKISFEALKNRPILGYGPENFSIGFDKYYDSTLPYMGAGWWDRAHNFIFDISVTAGVPALVIYLLLFGVLFFQLQKLKSFSSTNNESVANLRISEYLNPAILHGIQATFLAYLVANFFSFDGFSTYLISFLLIGYSLHLISENIPEKTFNFNIKGQSIITSVLFLGLVLFIWNFNIRPFQINTQINKAGVLAKNEQCEEAIKIMEEELLEKSYLDSYLRLKYVEFLGECEKSLSKKIDFHQKVSVLLAEGTKLQPYYTRNWILLGGVTNILIAREKNPELREKLKQAANYYLEKAHQLSPERQEVYTEWINTDLLTGEYQKAKEKSQECINLNPKLGYCWWLLALSNIYLNDPEAAQENINIAGQKGYFINSEASLSQLVVAYSKSKNYLKLIETYQGLINIRPEEPQYHASLAYTYKEIGQFEKAREEALIVLKLNPNLQNEVEAFLRTLPK